MMHPDEQCPEGVLHWTDLLGSMVLKAMTQQARLEAVIVRSRDFVHGLMKDIGNNIDQAKQ